MNLNHHEELNTGYINIIVIRPRQISLHSVCVESVIFEWACSRMGKKTANHSLSHRKLTREQRVFHVEVLGTPVCFPQ
jgi:hypothetical protein